MENILTPFDPSKTDEVIALWNQTLTADPITRDVFVANHLSDVNFDSDLLLLAHDKGTLIGFVYAIQKRFPEDDAQRFEDTAWIQCIAVDVAYRHIGVGTRLMEGIQAELKRRGVKRIVAGKYSPTYLFPGVDEANYPLAFPFFTKLGFKVTGTSFGMSIQLSDYTIPDTVNTTEARLREYGYEFEALTEKDVQSLLALLETQFKPSWLKAVRRLIQEGSYPKTIHIARYRNDIVGFTSRGGLDGDMNRFGPFGIHPEHRNQGLGEVLFHQTMKGMRDQGSTHAFFKSTDEKACRFYLRQGMRVDRIFIEMEKTDQT